jgi:glutamyl-tRNA reductase
MNGIGRFFVVGVSYRKADAAVRGLYSIGPERYEALLRDAEQFGLAELFVISTCNRTELYALADGSEQLLRAMAHVAGQEVADLQEISFALQGREAVRHFFQVTGGLDSQLLGDYEIVGQMKAAMRFAKERGGLGPFTERLANDALRSSKAVKNNTSITKGTVSVSFAAIKYLERDPAIADKNILVIGAGKMGRSACMHLVEHLGCRNITLINRTPERALALADRPGLKVRPYEELDAVLAAADVIIGATNAPEPIITLANITGEKEQCILDLGMPGNVQPEVAQLPNRTVLNVDEISHITDATLRERSSQVPMAMAIIDEVVHEFLEWSFMRERLGVLSDVRRKLESIHARIAAGEDVSTTEAQRRIKRVLKTMAVAMRTDNNTGCHFLRAINEYVAATRQDGFAVANAEEILGIARADQEAARELTIS